MTMQKAVVIKSAGKAEVTEVPIPAAKGNHVIVKTKAIALNPIDAVFVDYMPAPGSIVGCDYAGTIEKIGDGVKNDLKVGDRVAGAIMGANALQPEAGAFAEHAFTHADILFRIPPHMPDSEAATYPLAVITAGLSLYKSLGLPRPSTPAKEATPPLLIYGGNTAVGATAIQLAKLSNLQIITTCSPSANAYVTSLGASSAFDYRSPTCGADIAAACPTLFLVLDCISSADSTKISTTALGAKGGHHVMLLPPSVEAPANVKTTFLRSFGIFETRWKMGVEMEADEEGREWVKGWLGEVEGLLAGGKVRPHNPDVRKGGLEGVEEGIDDYRHKRVQGKKLVYEM